MTPDASPTARALLALELLQGAPGITGSRLNPNFFERHFSQDSTVGHTVQGHPTRHAKLLFSAFQRQPVRHREYGFFQYLLQRVRNIVMPLVQWSTALPWRAKQPGQVQICNLVAAMLVVAHDVAEFLQIGRRAIGCQGHYFVLV